MYMLRLKTISLLGHRSELDTLLGITLQISNVISTHTILLKNTIHTESFLKENILISADTIFYKGNIPSWGYLVKEKISN